jgi:multiple sugar transport system permease protein
MSTILRSNGIRATSRRRGDAGIALLFLLPNLSGFFVFLLLPILATLGLSLFNWPIIQPPKFIGLANFRQMFTADPAFGHVVVNTLVFVFAYVSANVVIALGFAAWLSSIGRGSTLFRSLLYLPVLVTPVAVAMIWQWIYAPRFGLLNWVLGLLGIRGPNWLGSTDWAMAGLVIMCVWQLFAQNMFIFIAGIQAVPATYYEAAKIDGANAWGRFIHVTLPMLSPVLFFGITMTLITSFQTFDQVFVLTLGGPGDATNILGLYVYSNAFRFFRMGYGATVAVVLFALVLFVTILQFWGQRHWVYYEST